MNMKVKTPLLVGVTALAFILSACDRPSADTAINSPATASAQTVTQSTPVPAAPNAPVQPTAEANSNDGNAPDLSPTETAVPAVQPNPTEAAPQPTAVPPQPTEVPAVVVAQSTPAPAASSASCTNPYTVQSGDRLFSIGRTCNVNPYAIAQANNIRGPYYWIYPGQNLIIPGINNGGNPTPQPTSVPGTNTYTVKAGDNLFRISLMFGKSMQAIAAANGLSNYNLIFIGQVLTIP